MSARDSRYPSFDTDLDYSDEAAWSAPRLTPGKRTLTSALPAPPMVFRAADPETARAFASALQTTGPTAATAQIDRASASSGAPLPATVRERFESSLGADLGAVRVHTGADSARAARSVGAQAYTTGQDIHFAEGRYDPGSDAGLRLLAHEVAHTVQQAGAAPRRQDKLEVSQPGDAAELEADAAAEAMVGGATHAITAAPGGAVSRKEESESKKDGKEDDKKAKRKPPSWADDTVTIPISEKLGAKLEFKWSDKPNGKATAEKSGKAEHSFIDFKHSQLVPIAGPVSVEVGAGVKGGLTAKATASVTGTWGDAPGPRVEDTQMLTIDVKGGGDVGVDLSGWLSLGAAIGAPGVYIVGGGKGTLGAEAKIGASLGGQLMRFPEGDISGAISFNLTGSAEIKAKADLFVDLVVPWDRYSLYTYKLGEHTIGQLLMSMTTFFDGKKATDLPPVLVAVWQPLPKFTEHSKRTLTEQQRALYLPVNQGASGAPAADPPTEVPVDCPEAAGAGGAGDGYCPPPAEKPAAPSGGNGGGGGASGFDGTEGGGNR